LEPESGSGPAAPAAPISAFVDGPRRLAIGPPGGSLHGDRFAVKNIIDVAGMVTGAGHPAWAASATPAAVHAPAVAALLAAGAELVGTTHADELAWSLSGTNAHYGTPGNPRAPDRAPGGSSSGSASAVAAGRVDLALGTDTGGSIRVPASYCGICGIRPTHGRIPVDGVIPLAPSFDTVGVLASSTVVLERGWQALSAVALPMAGRGTADRLVLAMDVVSWCDPGIAGVVAAAARTRLAEPLACRWWRAVSQRKATSDRGSTPSPCCRAPRHGPCTAGG
jgi:amidase